MYEDIKVGDVVFRKVGVRTGWSTTHSFWMPRKVEKITPKQFQVDGYKFRKEDGSRVGGKYGSSPCRNIGDIYHSNEVIDQSDDRKRLIFTLNKKGSAREEIDLLRSKLEHDNPNLIEIAESINKAAELLKAGLESNNA